MKRLTFAALAFAVLAGCTVQTTPGSQPVAPDEPPPPPPRERVVEAPPRHEHHQHRPRPERGNEWERRGYKLVGEINIPPGQNGGKFVVSPTQGRITDIAVVVLDGELRMFGFVITFRSGADQVVQYDKVFRSGSSHTTDIENFSRGINTLYFRSESQTMKGSPRVQLWGKDRTSSMAPVRQKAQFAAAAAKLAPAITRSSLLHAQSAPAPSRPVTAPKRLPPPPPPPAPAQGAAPAQQPTSKAARLPLGEWERRGYKLLGEVAVPHGQNGGKIVPPKAQNRNNDIALVVVGGELPIHGAVVQLVGGGQKVLQFNEIFLEGGYVQSELKENTRGIDNVYFRATGSAVRGQPRVQLWGRDANAPAPAPPPPAWNPSGWTLLGAQEVGGRRDRDTVNVSGAAGTFSALTLVVEDSDIELYDMAVTFTDGQVFQPNIRATFREGSRSRVIDLPGTARAIRKIDFRYGNLPGTGRAKVQVWGKGSNTPPPPSGPTWDQRGWTLLGQKAIFGAKKGDSILVRSKGTYFTNLTLAVDDGEVEVTDVVVHFSDGLAYIPPIRHYFRGGERSRTIDLPGEPRVVTKVDYKINGLPRGMRATVQVWGKAGSPPVDRWKSEGWTELSDTLVSRKGVQRIRVGKNKGGFSKLVLVADGSQLDVTSLIIKFGRGAPVEVPVTHSFRDGSMSREIDLPAESIAIQWIELRYGKLGVRDTSRVAVYAR